MQSFQKRFSTRLLVLLSVGWMAVAPLASAEIEPIKVHAGRYLVTRKGLLAQSSPPSQRRYDVRASTGYFDLVAIKDPATVGVATTRSRVEAQAEVLDWRKVYTDCEEIRRDPSVDLCEPDILVPLAAVPNDPFFANQWALADSVGNADVEATEAWDLGTGTRSTLVGIIDSGIYFDHPDLVENLWSNPSEPADGVDNDGNGYIDDFFGISAVTGTNNPQDCSGHGTHVAGIIGAKGNNSVGITGVNWTVSMIAAGAAPDCTKSLSTAAIVAAYNYFYDLKVRGHNVRVINASFAGPTFSLVESQAIERLNQVGILLVAAAGNNSQNLDLIPSYPASYELPNVISVAATGPQLLLSSYSNFGSGVDIAAPGGAGEQWNEAILSTYSPLAPGASLYTSLEGTSMAAPMVSGALALIASQVPDLGAADLKRLLIESAFRVTGLEGFVEGGRFLNLKGMAVLAASQTDNCPSDPSKREPGVCGCGIADTDSDGDGVANCQDRCPSSTFKNTPGVCGCEVEDADANANGLIDCLETGISTLVPAAPRLRTNRNQLLISMQGLQGVRYYVQVTVSPPRRTRRRSSTTYYEAAGPNVVLRKPLVGSRVQVRYAYLVVGATDEVSFWSDFTSRSIGR